MLHNSIFVFPIPILYYFYYLWLQESWDVNTKTKESVISYVLSFRDKLNTVYSLVTDNL